MFCIEMTLRKWTFPDTNAGALYHWILPATTGSVRESLLQLSFLNNRQDLAFSVYLNPAIWMFIMTGRIVIDILLFGPEATFKGLRSRTFTVLKRQ